MQEPHLLIFSSLWRREKYYHTDHLGSATLITDDAADVVQQIAYLPYGEDWVDIRHHGYFGSAYKFNGKEKDDETGYSYYGARYYTDRLSIWLSVDPLADKYPHLSPYAYCADNPILYVDSDGQKISLPKGTSTKNIYLILGNLQKLTNDKLVYSTQKDGTIRIKVASLGDGNKTAGTNLIRRLNSSDKTLMIDIKDSQGNFLYRDGNQAKATNYTNAANGVGSDAIVSFDPTSNPNIMTKDPKTGTVSGKTRPNQIGLGYELIHAEHYMDGDYSPATSTSTHTYKDASGNTVTQTYKTEELRTVGIAGTKKDDITENQLRKEQKQNPRGAY